MASSTGRTRATGSLTDRTIRCMTAEPVAHWGTTNADVLFHPERYGPYAAAHHVAGHHWARHRLDFARWPAAVRMHENELFRPEREKTSVVEATAVLVEALAIEAAVCADMGVDFTCDLDVDWDLIREHCGSANHHARVRGCTAPAGSVEVLLRHQNWVHGTGRKILRDWAGIAGLADALGRGQVLEVDETLKMLRR